MNNHIEPSQLESLKGRLVTYPEMCRVLGLKVKTGDSRNLFFDKLKLCCKVEKVGRKYRIDEIYDSNLFCEIHGNNKFQIYIDQLIMEAFKRNDYNPIYLSRTELFLELGLVNHNYKIAKSREAVRLLGANYYYLIETIPEISSILSNWIIRRIKSLQSRGVIMYSSGYRLIKKQVYNNQIIYMKENLVPNSEKEKLAMKAVYNARKFVLPESLIETDWIPDYYLPAYQDALRKEIIQSFGVEYENIVPVMSLRSTDKIINSHLKSCRKILNNESMRKIQTTKRLNFLTGKQREQITSEIIDLSADINYSNLISQKYKK